MAESTTISKISTKFKKIARKKKDNNSNKFDNMNEDKGISSQNRKIIEENNFKGSDFEERYLSECGDIETANRYCSESQRFRNGISIQKLKIDNIKEKIINYGMFIRGIGKNGYPNLYCQNIPFNEADYADLLIVFSYILDNYLRDYEKLNIFVDLRDFTMKGLDERIGRVILEVLKIAYPDSFGICIAYNSPLWCKGIYALLYPWLPKIWKKRLYISYGNIDGSKYVENSEIPSNVGGSGPKYDSNDFVKDVIKLEESKPDEWEGVDPRMQFWLQRLPTSAKDVSPVRLDGILYKMGGVVKQWKKYYCILYNGGLVYCKNDTDIKPQGVILLDRAEIKEDTENEELFYIITPLRKFQFNTKSTSIKEEWVKKLIKEKDDLIKSGNASLSAVSA